VSFKNIDELRIKDFDKYFSDLEKANEEGKSDSDSSSALSDSDSEGSKDDEVKGE